VPETARRKRITGLPTFTVDELVEATGGTPVRGKGSRVVSGVCTDSRAMHAGSVFIPLIGDRFDGHDFLALAGECGAACVIVAEAYADKEKDIPERCAVIRVADTLRSLGDIARYHRLRFDVPLVAVTGSSGKTTTKEMICAILGRVMQVLKSRGNYNNLIGLPLTLLEMNAHHDCAVVEMGTNCRGEIARLAEIARPHAGVITNVGPAHLAGFGSLEVVAEEKGALFAGLCANGTAVVNAGDERVKAAAQRWPGAHLVYGVDDSATGDADYDVTARNIRTVPGGGMSFRLVLGDEEHAVKLRIMGRHNVENALAAVAVCRALGCESETIVRGLAAFTGVPGRMAVVPLRNGVRVIDDSYNANPASLRASLEALTGAAQEGRRFVVLGDMLELGEAAAERHEEAGRDIADARVTALFLEGEHTGHVAAGAQDGGMPGDAIYVPPDTGAFTAAIRAVVQRGDWILVKGSRRMAMERYVEVLKDEFGVGEA